MRRTSPALLLAFSAFLCSGCSICAPGYIHDYATIGGIQERSDPTTGRLGSILSDPGSTLVSHGAEYFGPQEVEYYDDGYQESIPGGYGGQLSDEYQEYSQPIVPGEAEGVIILDEEW